MAKCAALAACKGAGMSMRTGLATMIAALLVTGCASTRGGQDIVCERFDEFAVDVVPARIVADIQRYGIENRGGKRRTKELQADQRPESLDETAPEAAAPPPTMDAAIGEALFGLSDAELIEEAARMRSAYESAKASGAELEALGQEPVENRIIVTGGIRPRNILLLSGGGMWGAYGAGLFLGMACTDPLDGSADGNRMPCMIEGADGTRTIDRARINFEELDELKIGVITGVSTGGLQSLLLMVILDPTQHEETREDALQQLLDSYAPEKRSDLVDYDGFLAVLFQGSVAGTDPLLGHVREVLGSRWGFRDAIYSPTGSVTGYIPAPDRRLVDQIARSPITTMVGIVEGEDGLFKSIDMKAMVGEIQRDGPASGREAQGDAAMDCVLATTLASSAMPVFHQQLRVMKRPQPEKTPENAPNPQPSPPPPAGRELVASTLFDGGVRRSVFASQLGAGLDARDARLAEALGPDLYRAARAEGRLPKTYVLRNGPTTSVEEAKANTVDNAIDQALRAYSLIVNEVEVGSIAALRLSNPYGTIRLSTADGSENIEFAHPDRTGPLRAPCAKKIEMFDPEFMRCLQNFGARRGMELEYDKDGQPIPPFWELSPIEPSARRMAPPAEPGR